MSKPPEHTLNHVTDFAALSEEQFQRMLPDFCRWFTFAKEMQEVGARATDFVWIDDGDPGVLSEVRLVVDGTDETHTFDIRNKAQP